MRVRIISICSSVSCPNMVIFAAVVALACLTTAVSLLSATAGYFHALFHEKIPYVCIVAVFCVSSAVVSNIGLDQIISIASLILDVIYPPVLVLIILSYVKKGTAAHLLLYGHARRNGV